MIKTRLHQNIKARQQQLANKASDILISSLKNMKAHASSTVNLSQTPVTLARAKDISTQMSANDSGSFVLETTFNKAKLFNRNTAGLYAQTPKSD